MRKAEVTGLMAALVGEEGLEGEKVALDREEALVRQEWLAVLWVKIMDLAERGRALKQVNKNKNNNNNRRGEKVASVRKEALVRQEGLAGQEVALLTKEALVGQEGVAGHWVKLYLELDVGEQCLWVKTLRM